MDKARDEEGPPGGFHTLSKRLAQKRAPFLLGFFGAIESSSTAKRDALRRHFSIRRALREKAAQFQRGGGR
jgi:hypothetical protein